MVSDERALRLRKIGVLRQLCQRTVSSIVNAGERSVWCEGTDRDGQGTRTYGYFHLAARAQQPETLVAETLTETFEIVEMAGGEVGRELTRRARTRIGETMARSRP